MILGRKKAKLKAYVCLCLNQHSCSKYLINISPFCFSHFDLKFASKIVTPNLESFTLQHTVTKYKRKGNETQRTRFYVEMLRFFKTIRQEHPARAEILLPNLASSFARAYEPDSTPVPIAPTQNLFFWFCLLVFHQAGLPLRIYCLALMGNKHEVFIPKTQRCIETSGIKPGISNLSIVSPMLF